MLSRIAAFASLAMLATPVAALPTEVTMVRICTGTGIRMMAMPMDDGDPAPKDCAKACHAMCESRKKPGKRVRVG